MDDAKPRYEWHVSQMRWHAARAGVWHVRQQRWHRRESYRYVSAVYSAFVSEVFKRNAPRIAKNVMHNNTMLARLTSRQGG